MICSSCQSDNPATADVCFNCGKALYALTKGTALADRYEILEFLGRGGMGVVYHAFDRKLEEHVAVKVLRSDLATSEGLGQRFRSEIKLARRVRHRNVCGIHEYGQSGALSFIVMELIDGVDLASVVRDRGALPYQEAREIAVQIADGLAAIHDVGIVHRDLKTQNIMQDRDGVVRLMDFGLAKQLGVEASAMTGTGQVLGTPEYMSPEQARGESLDLRSDIYSLGIVFFELFTGHVPFRGDTPLATIFKHLQDPPPLDHERLKCAPDLVPILRRALAKSPHERQESATALANELRGARQPPIATRPSQPAPTTPAPKDGLRVPGMPSVGTPPRPPAPLPATVARGSQPPSWRRTLLLAVGLGSILMGAGAIGSVLALRTWLSFRSQGAPSASEPSRSPAQARLGAASSEPASGSSPSNGAPWDGPVSPSAPPEASPSPPPAAAVAQGAPAPEAVETLSAQAPGTRGQPTSSSELSPSPGPEATRVKATSAGQLQLLVLPWAEIVVDGKSLGTTPMKPVSLAAGRHDVVLKHPRYKPLHKRVILRGGETTRLEVDLAFEAFPK